MAYFLKKIKQQNRIYLAIYESFYSPDVNGTKHRCFKSLGNIQEKAIIAINSALNNTNIPTLMIPGKQSKRK